MGVRVCRVDVRECMHRVGGCEGMCVDWGGVRECG